MNTSTRHAAFAVLCAAVAAHESSPPWLVALALDGPKGIEGRDCLRGGREHGRYGYEGIPGRTHPRTRCPRRRRESPRKDWGEVDVLEMGHEEACSLGAEVHFRDRPQRRCDRRVRAT